MSLNNIKMPPQLLAGLYADTLVETTLEETTLEENTLEEAVLVEVSTTEVSVTETDLIVQEESIVKEESIAQEEVIIQEVLPAKEQPIKEEPHRFDFMGNNRKQILILVAHDKSPYLPEHELKFLVSVLKACGLTTEDVAILNLKKQPSDHIKLHTFFQYRINLLFGQGPLDIDLPMNFPQFQLQNYNKCTYLHAPALSEIEKAKELKMKLWSSLKNMFSL